MEATGKPVAIYKRLDAQPDLPLEERNYYAHFPIRGTRGKRKSLLVTTREEAESRAQEETVNMRVQLQQGVTLVKTTVQSVVEKFLAHKRARVRVRGRGKQEAGRKTITQERYGLIRGKLENYLVPFLGAKTDAKSIPKTKWNEWEGWRRINGVKGGAPKADTLLNEMGHIRECWKWAMEQGLIPIHQFFLSTMKTLRLTTKFVGILGNYRNGTLSSHDCPNGYDYSRVKSRRTTAGTALSPIKCFSFWRIMECVWVKL